MLLTLVTIDKSVTSLSFFLSVSEYSMEYISICVFESSDTIFLVFKEFTLERTTTIKPKLVDALINN
jgi:hypothetical protein